MGTLAEILGQIPPVKPQPVAQSAGFLKSSAPINEGGRPDYLLPLLSKMGMKQEDAVQLARRLYSQHPEGVLGMHVPKGPHKERATPTLIPNADEKVFTENNAAGYPMPRFVPRPAVAPGPPINRISLPEDPSLHQAYLEMISGGST